MRLSLMVLAALTLGCDPQAGEVADARPIVEAQNAALARWYGAGQIDSVAMAFAADAWQMPPNQAPLIGRDAIREFWSNAAAWGHWTFDLKSQDVVTTGAYAEERGKYVLSFDAGPNAPSAMGSFQDRGNYVVIWRLDSDGKWRVLWDAPVSEVPLPGQAP